MTPHRSRIGSLAVLLVLLSSLCSCGGGDADVTLPEIELETLDPLVRGAVEKAMEEVRQSPEEAAPWGRLAMICDVHDLLAPAAEAYREAMRLDAEDARWPALLVHATPDATLEEHVDWLDRAHRLDPDHRATRARLARVLVRAGQTARAEVHLKALFEADRDDPHVRLDLARVAVAREELEQARRHLLRARRKAPDHREVHALLAQVLTRLGQIDAAREAAAEAARLSGTAAIPDPMRRELAPLATGWVHELQRMREAIAVSRADAARPIFDLLVRTFPDRASELDAEKGNLALLAGDQPTAITAWLAALSREPAHPSALTPAVHVLTTLGRAEEGVALMEAAGAARFDLKGVVPVEARARRDARGAADALAYLDAREKAGALPVEARALLAWCLVEGVPAAAANGERALKVLASLPEPRGLDRARHLRLVAMATHMAGRGADAIRMAREAQGLARQAGASALVDELATLIASWGAAGG